MQAEQIHPDVTVDVSGLMCPMPGLKISKALKKMSSDEIIEVRSNNPIVKKFIPMISKKFGTKLLGRFDDDTGFYMQKVQ